MLSAQRSETTDTSKVWIPRKDAIKVFTAAEKYKVAADHIELLKKDTTFLANEIRSLKVALAALQKTDSLYILKDTDLRKQIALHEEKFTLANTKVTQLEKENKKLRRRVRNTAIAGIITTGVAIYLSLK